MDLTYSGNTLPETIVNQLITYARNDLRVPPSYLITKLHYEGLWGGSAVAQADNNWGGMTWVGSWSNPQERSSGVTVTRGGARPANEGGYYIHYDTVNDFIIDWCYLIRRGGIYNVADSETFADAVKGCFVYGGAQYDYATMNVNGSQLRYELYLQGMEARRASINSANSGALDTIDADETIPEGDFPEDTSTVLGKMKSLINKLDLEYSKMERAITSGAAGMTTGTIYDYGNGDLKGNGFIKIDKVFGNMYHVSSSTGYNGNLAKIIDDGQSVLADIRKELGMVGSPADPSNPAADGKPAFPTTEGLAISSPWGWRISPITGGWEFHGSLDIGGGGTNHPLYATQSGTVIKNEWHNLWGWLIAIKHSGDTYSSQYAHMANQSPVALGATVTKGQTIGTMGTTGNSTGIHLDFGIYKTDMAYNDTNTVDPVLYLNMQL